MSSKFAIPVSATQFSKSSPPLATKLQENIFKVLQEIVPDLKDSISPDDHLTDLLPTGRLDSLLTIRFKQALEDRLELKFSIPVTVLFKVNTIAEIEYELLKLSIATNPGLALTIASEGSKTPLFLFPPGGGECAAWLELIKYLPDRPIYAFRLRGLQADEEVFGSLDEMIDVFESEILALHPKGPYALLGLCFGGNVAFEIAKRLESRGEEVSFVGGIDNAPSIAHMRFDALRYFIIDILASRKLLSAEEQADLKLKLKDTHEDKFPHIVMTRYRSRLTAVGVTVERLTRWQKVFYSVAAITEQYEPTGKISNYHSFYASPRPEWEITEKQWKVLTGSWADFSRERYHRRVDGDHYTVLTKANIDVFQNALLEELN